MPLEMKAAVRWSEQERSKVESSRISNVFVAAESASTEKSHALSVIGSSLGSVG